MCRRDGSGHGRNRGLPRQRVVGGGRYHQVARAAAAEVAAADAGQCAQRDVAGRADGLGGCDVRAAEIEGDAAGVQRHRVAADLAAQAAAHRRAGRGQHAVVDFARAGDARRRRELRRRDGL